MPDANMERSSEPQRNESGMWPEPGIADWR